MYDLWLLFLNLICWCCIIVGSSSSSTLYYTLYYMTVFNTVSSICTLLACSIIVMLFTMNMTYASEIILYGQ